MSLGQGVLDTLLIDRTTGENIIWASDDYAYLGEAYTFHQHITADLITGDNQYVIQPRVAKREEERRHRSRKMAEVFTPSWVCNKMNNGDDEAWFKRKPVFNVPHDETQLHWWEPTTEKITFPEGKTWQEYVGMGVIEITCGEAPFLASRYDTVTNNNTTMTKYSEFIKHGNQVCYKGRKVTIDEILDYTFEEIPTDEELDDAPHLYYAGIIYDDMATDTIPVCRLKPLRQVSDLNVDELIALWRQIRVGSLSYKDYSNTLGIERKYLSDVCDAYVEAIETTDSYEWLRNDTPQNFAEYCMDYCCI